MPMEWTAKVEEAAQLLAEGRLSDTDIAQRLEVDRRTLYNWRQDTDFRARVAAILAEFVEEIRRRGIAVRERRIKRQNDSWNRLQTVIEERAEAYTAWRDKLQAENRDVPEIPGGRTGLLVFDGEAWLLDAALLKELRALEKHTGMETGQWTEKHEIDLRRLSDEELITRATSLVGGGRPAGDHAAG